METWSYLDAAHGHYINEKKNQISKGCILCDSIFVTFSKWQHYSDGENIIGFQGAGWLERDYNC